MLRSKSAVRRLCWKICCLLFISIASATTTTAARTSSADSSETTVNNSNNNNKRNENVQRSTGGNEDCTDLARDEETLMVFSTLGGGLTAIDPITSEIRWTIADDPPIKAEQQQNVQVPQYLPDPRDGSIYQLGTMGSLKKLPYTIPELVASAPCRSSDGILYSGKKSDTWFIVDPKTGRREKVMGFGGGSPSLQENGGGGEKIGWATSRAIYLGRTQYTVMMYDSQSHDKNAKPWNITFYDYSAHMMTPSISKEYEYLHLTTTTNGNIVTLDRKNGKFLWKRDLNSPVVAAFLLGSEGLLSVPFTTVSDEAFTAILEESNGGNVNTVKLFQSLYVGEHNNGLFALPSLVDKHTPRIATTPPIKLINGPTSKGGNSETVSPPTSQMDPQTVYIDDVIDKNSGILLGHYNLPPDGQLLMSSDRKAVSNNNPLKEEKNGLATTADGKWSVAPNMAQLNVAGNGFTLSTFAASSGMPESTEKAVQTETPSVEITFDSSSSQQATAFNRTIKKIILANSDRIHEFINEWFMDHPSSKVHQILIVMVLCMVAMFWYLCSTMRELKIQNSETGSKTYNSGTDGDSRSSNGSNASDGNHHDLIDLGGGQVRVGKISFRPSDVLGKGCEGTFVFRGTFEERSVAVKRLLPECFTFADREVALLRESDAHENVVRYFCTEQDRQFRYIAVELCTATLQDYTESSQSETLRAQIGPLEVLRQAVAGLNHLHSLNIVHRDIKPQNVLLSLPDVRGKVRVMISDFGLCKKLNFGKTSFSRRSGVTGTDGWIAPEMMHGQRTTTSVDIFSLGCVYYYVLSGGHHAFGDALKRQANILSNESDLSQLREVTNADDFLDGTMILAEQLIADMINEVPNNRPSAQHIGNHPIFWSEQKVLAFLQDVSDRVEKLQFHVEPLRSLEKNGQFVVLDDWNLHLDPLITEDLRKYRGYMGASVRDLLRALRNKKHHYHELTPAVQGILGSVPHEFTRYWIRKFPHLISHTYHAFSICADEPLFQPYYNYPFLFARPSYFEMDYSFYPSVLLNDPKPLLKQSGGGSASPKRNSQVARTTPERNPTHQQQQQQLGKTRKGTYNFRKPAHIANNDVEGPYNVGLQRNLLDADRNHNKQLVNNNDNNMAEASDTAILGEIEADGRRNVFSNFKFRRHQNRNNNYNQEKNIQWTLPNTAKDTTDE